MAKKLLIVRHGKAEKSSPDGQDASRPLTKDGSKDAIAVAEKLLQKNIVPALMISSNAKRAHKTAKLFAATWNIPVDAIVLEHSIYEASVRQLLSIIEALDNSYEFVALFGHNPSLTSLINILADTNIYGLSTGSAALVEFDFADWNMIPAGGKLSLLIEP